MSDIRFSCPGCGQHFAGEARYMGMQIKCPNCQQPFIVPSARAAVPVAQAAAPAPVAVPSARTTPQPAVTAPVASPPRPVTASLPVRGPARTSRLALASLICSIGSFIVVPFGFIPGIICGHMARKRIAQDPSLSGRGMAKAGLIVGYASLGIQVLAVAFFVFVGVKFAQEASAPFSQSSPATLGRPGRPPGVAGRLPLTLADTAPDAAGWTLKLKASSIPANPVSGRLKGSNFLSERTSVQGGLLRFVQGADSAPDFEMNVALPVSLGGQLSGKTFTIPSKEPGGTPQISMKWKDASKNASEEVSWTEGYAMILQFDKMANGRLPGKIYLCVPDEDKSFIRGTFEVHLRRERGAPVAPGPS
jgi:hypothetical protein